MTFLTPYISAKYIFSLLGKTSLNLLLHVVQDVLEVQIIVVVLDSFSYAALKQGRRLEENAKQTDMRGGQRCQYHQRWWQSQGTMYRREQSVTEGVLRG